MMQKSKYFILKNVISTYFLQPLCLSVSLSISVSLSLSLSLKGRKGRKKREKGEKERMRWAERERDFSLSGKDRHVLYFLSYLIYI